MLKCETELRERLASAGQSHLLAFWDRLDEEERAALTTDLERVHWDRVQDLTRELESSNGAPLNLSAPEVFSASDAKYAERLSDARTRGEDLLRNGRVAVLTVAGGQGTRLGFLGPKGLFRIMPLTGKCLFQHFAETIRATAQYYGCDLPWYVMTSPENHDTTAEYFKSNNNFGITHVRLFTQGMIPAVDANGRALLAERNRLALAPDGHGGTLNALAQAGAVEEMITEGVEYISYFQVDNPLVRTLDPTFIGLVDIESSDVGSKAIRKAYDEEKVGVFVKRDDKLAVIEYSDMPDELVHQRKPDGSRTYDFANMAVHVFRVGFIRDLVNDETGLSMPWHRAHKKVPCVAPETGRRVVPDTPNAIKFEQFIFDALPLAHNPLIYEVLREEEFSPVKNAEGVDSPATSRAHLIERARKWLRQCGIDPEGHRRAVEISPLVALEPTQLAQRLPECTPQEMNGGLYYGE